MSPMTSPIVRSATTSMLDVGSSSFGRLIRAPRGRPCAARRSGTRRRRVDVVVLAVEEADLHVDHLVAGEEALLHRLDDALLDRRDELRAGWRRRPHRRDEAHAAAAGIGSHVDVRRTGRGRRTASCACKHARRPCRTPRRKAAARTTMLASTPRLGAHPVDHDLEVQLAHAAEQRLARLLVYFETQRRVGLHHLVERRGHLVDVGARLRLDRDADDGVREAHAL